MLPEATDLWLLCGDARTVLAGMPAGSVHTCITSPPYFGLRSYNGGAQEIGTEQTPQAYVAALVEVFGAVRRVLRDDGTLWVVLGDSFNSGSGGGNAQLASSVASVRGGGHKQGALRGRAGPKTGLLPPKSLLGIPWRVAFALQEDGWILRQELIWAKPNPMPESVKDRCTRGHETVFMLAKGPRYHYDQDAIREPHAYGMNGGAFSRRYRAAQLLAQNGSHNIERTINPAGRNKRSVWTVATSPLSSKKYGVQTEHYAAFPPELVRPMVRAACPTGGVVLDPFCGSGTTGLVAVQEGRRFVGVDLSPAYIELARRRIATAQRPLLAIAT